MRRQPYCTRTPPTHTSYRWRGDRVMNPISVWGWLGGHDDGQKPMGEFSRITPLLFFEGHPGIFNDTKEFGPRFNISRCLLTVLCPRHYTEVLGPTQTTGWAPPAGLTNTFQQQPSFPRSLPSRYWPAQPCSASVGTGLGLQGDMAPGRIAFCVIAWTAMTCKYKCSQCRTFNASLQWIACGLWIG